MIMMNGDSPVPGSSPTLPISAALPTSSGSLQADLFPNGPAACTGCGQPILDEFILRVQSQLWHARCLRCAACHALLSQTCYVHGTRVFCQGDFFSLFGAGCSGCGEVIPPTEAVRTAQENVYHLKCFACITCSKALQTGDQFYLREDGKLICKPDVDKLQEQEAQAAAAAAATAAAAAAATTAAATAENSEGSSSRQDPHQGQPIQPSRGHHNSLDFTPQETEILFRIHSACPNPSHAMLQQISSQHGLDLPKVGLWFYLQGKPRREEGASYGTREMGMERASAPLVSAASSGRLPPSSRSDLMGGIPFPCVSQSSCTQTLSTWPLSDDVLRPDFVPPNVDLNPCDIKDGEVCTSRRGLPPSPMTAESTARGQCRFMSSGSGKGGDCQQEQITARGARDVALPWMDS